jgi:antitoxin MazE
MTTKIQKWGNSLAVRIPKEVAEGFRSGVSVELTREGSALIVRPSNKKKFTLKDLVSNIKPKHLHKETNWGDVVGRELM